jgi:hypothetical protein
MKLVRIRTPYGNAFINPADVAAIIPVGTQQGAPAIGACGILLRNAPAPITAAEDAATVAERIDPAAIEKHSGPYAISNN